MSEFEKSLGVPVRTQVRLKSGFGLAEGWDEVRTSCDPSRLLGCAVRRSAVPVLQISVISIDGVAWCDKIIESVERK